MHIDANKISDLFRGAADVLAGAWRREGNLVFIGVDQPASAALEEIFASDDRAPVELFHFRFPELAAFVRMEETVRAVRKNFRGGLLGNFHFLPAAAVIDQAYAAGLDLLDLPQPVGSEAPTAEWLDALAYARSVFPRWGVVSTVAVAGGPLEPHYAAIDLFLARGVLPLLSLDPAAAGHDRSQVASLFAYLQQQWQRAGALTRPLQPLLQATTPLVLPAPRRGLAALLDKVQEAQWRTASDLRRLLRVREVEQSFESAGL